MEVKKIKVGIVGAAGFVAGELIRLLIHHPMVQLVSLQSSSQAGKKIYQIHSDLFHSHHTFDTDLKKDLDVIFITRGHGQSKSLMENELSQTTAVVIDLSSDFRISNPEHNFVYGLPEWNREKIKQSYRIANCGCFATAIQLALYPLLTDQLISDDLHIQGITGSTGAGFSKLDTTHFSWRESNVSIYKAFEHQHLDEVFQLINAHSDNFGHDINFIPMRGNFTRGILISMYTKVEASFEEIWNLYKATYDAEPFVEITKDAIHLKQVVNTNYCLLQIEKYGDRLLITSVIDNLLKGAAGQAVQNMNIRFGFPETTGLQLKPSAF